MRWALVFFLWIPPTQLVSDALASNSTPDGTSAAVYDPVALYCGLASDSTQVVLSEEGYGGYDRFVQAQDGLAPDVGFWHFLQAVGESRAILHIHTHSGSDGWFGFQFFPWSTSGYLAALDSAYACDQSYPNLDFAVGPAPAVWGDSCWTAAVKMPTVAAGDYVEPQYFVDDVSCHGESYYSVWGSAIALVRNSAGFHSARDRPVWTYLGGHSGKDKRPVGRAIEEYSTIIPHGDVWTVLAPTVSEFAPLDDRPVASKDSFYCTVHFDCLMDVSDCVVYGDETYCHVDSVHWQNDTTLVFTVHGTGTNGTGQVLIGACHATSAGNGTCLDGNTYPGGTDGHGPNGDDFVLEYRFMDNQAAAIDFLEVSQGQIIWRSSQEDGTVAYRILGSNNPESDDWQVASEEIPAQGAPAEYSAPVPAGWDYVKLQEKEDRWCGERWLDHGIRTTHPPVPSAPADDSPSGPPFVHVVGLDENVGEIESFLEGLAAAGVDGQYEVLPEIDHAVVDQILATRQHGDTLAIIWPRPSDGAQQEGEEKGGRRVWGVGVLGPEEYENALNAYRNALNQPIHWPPGEAFVAQTYLVHGAQDSATVCGWINDEHGGEYWVLFGRVDECNSPDSTTMPCPYFPDTPYPVMRSCAFTLWDWERGLSDTVAKYVGYVPVENIDDLWVYWAKMVSYKWNSDWIDYKRRLGAWALDEDKYGRSGAYVREQMESVLDLAHPAWEVDPLWASELSCTSGAETDSSVSALSEGRSLVLVLGTYSDPRSLGSFLCTSPSSCCYSDIRSELANTNTYAHVLALSCDLHGINQLDVRPMVAQELLLVPCGGAVTSIGPSGGFYQDYYHMYLAKFMHIYNEEGGDMTIGQMHKRVRNSLLAESPSDSLMSLFCKVLPLLGDPTIKVGGPNSSMYLAVEEERRRAGSRFALQNPVPNPFNPTVAVSFSLPDASHISLRVYNIRGQLVRSLLDGWADAGEHQVSWDGKNDQGVTVGSGVYFCQLVSGKHSQTTKLVLLR